MASNFTDDLAFTDDGGFVENKHQLVLNTMGIGTFLIFFFTAVLATVWLFSSTCEVRPKVTSRGIALVVFLIVVLILIFAEREPKFEYKDYEEKIYDESIIPRVVISLIMMLFSAISAGLCFAHHSEPRTVRELLFFYFTIRYCSNMASNSTQ